MKAIMPNISVSAICSCLPENTFEISSLSSIYGEKRIKRIINSTGVERVHIADEDVTASDLCIRASEHLLDKLSIARETIDAVVFASFSPDYILPATSARIQHKLGLKKETVIFDINYGCSAYIYGLYQASILIKSGGCKKVLVCCGDVQSKLINAKDRSLKVILGDAGSATLVEEGTGNMNFLIKTDGSGYQHLIIPAGGERIPYSEETSIEKEYEDGNVRSQNDLYMDGMQVMRFALKEVPPVVSEIMHITDWSKEEVGTYAFHQPNKLVLDYLRSEIGIDNHDAFPIALKNTGNTAAASIPLLLCLEHEKLRQEKRLNKVVACGFGIGLSWGAATMDLSNTEILNVIRY